MKKYLRLVLSMLLVLCMLAVVPFAGDYSFADEEELQVAEEQTEAVEALGEETEQNLDGGQQEGNQEEQGETQPEPEPVPEPEPQPVYPVYSPNASRIPILTYHMVVSDKQKKKGKYRKSTLAVSQSQFDQQMAYLSNAGYLTISCDEFYKWYTGEITLPVKSVLITFDDGAKGVADYGLPVLQKYNMKATVFIVGSRTYNNKSNSISYARMLEIQQTYPNMEFQSHTYGLHKHVKKKGVYAKVYNDACYQRSLFGFNYLAYPYGANSAEMRAAYADAGIKLAFTYGKNGYATRDQNIFQIRRIKVNAKQSFKKFRKWV